VKVIIKFGVNSQGWYLYQWKQRS